MILRDFKRQNRVQSANGLGATWSRPKGSDQPPGQFFFANRFSCYVMGCFGMAQSGKNMQKL